MEFCAKKLNAKVINTLFSQANLSVAMGTIIIISTYPDEKSVSKIADLVIQKRLAACVNFTKINSVYRWQGKIEHANEFLALFKTTNKAKPDLKNQIKKSHPYEVPEIVEIKVDAVVKSYLDWLVRSTSRHKSQKRNYSPK